MSLYVVSGPAIEPITVSEAKKQIRMGSSAGEPAPTAPTAALAGAGAGNVDNGARRYGVTFVTADGETELGEVSAALTVADKTVNGQVSLTNIPLGGAFVTSRKIYRTVAGGSTYLLLTTLANNTATTYTDNTADASLGGAQAPTTNTTANPELVSWIQAVREVAESYTRRRLITQDVDWKLDRFPGGSQVLRLPLGSVQSITSISYLDNAGATQTWPTAEYRTDLPTGFQATTGRITPAYGYNWPTTQNVMNAVTVRMVVGYGAARSNVPEGIKVGMKALIGHWDRSREAVVVGAGAIELPLGVRWAWKPFRVVIP